MQKTLLTNQSLQSIMTSMGIFNKSKPIDYKYNEGELLKEFTAYVDSTYDQHYSLNKYQATEFIMDAGHGEGFCIGNIMKYSQRYVWEEGWEKSCRPFESYPLWISCIK